MTGWEVEPVTGWKWTDQDTARIKWLRENYEQLTAAERMELRETRYRETVVARRMLRDLVARRDRERATRRAGA